MKSINDEWEEFKIWLEIHPVEEPIFDDGWIGHPDEWDSGNVPEPPLNFEGEYWETE